MKIYIMTDMECVSGLRNNTELESDGPGYRKTQESLTGDVNAAAEGCFEAGADEVLVRDAHGVPGNLVMEQLDPRVQIACEAPGNWSGLDESIDATIMLGQHAKAGTINAFLDHTQSSASVFDFTANDISLGETGQWALMAGGFDIPVVFLAGDDAACREAEGLLPGIQTVSTGTAAGRMRMAPRNQATVRKEITATVADTLKNKAAYNVQPYRLDTPITVRLTFYRTDMADRSCRLRSDRVRIDGRTVEVTVNSPVEILNIFA